MRPSRMVLAALVIGAYGAWGAGGAAWAEPPTDQQIEAAIDDVSRRVEGLVPPALFEARAAAVREAMARVSIAEATLAQIERLRAKGMIAEPAHRVAAFDRLGELAKEPTIDGAAAAAVRMDLASPDLDTAMTPEDRSAARQQIGRAGAAALRHPAIGAAWRGGRGLDVLGRMHRGDPAELRGDKVIDALDRALEPNLGWDVVVRLTTLVEALSSPRAGHGPEALQRIARRARAILDELKPTSPEDERSVGVLRRFYDGAMARGELIGHAAPWPRLEWASAGCPRDLNEWKGRVVVAVFWHTGARGANGTLAAAEMIRARFEGSPVSVVVITSLQGKATDYTDPKKPVRVDTTGNPQREYDLTRAHLDVRKNACHVAFAETVFNPDFGVVRIPVVGVVDPEGKVSLRTGDPRETIDEIAAEVERLLERFNLPRPAATKDDAEAKPAAEPVPAPPGGG